MNPLVSIVIPTYGRPDQLARAINSCLKQKYEAVEIIVVDDNNPDTDARKLTESVMAAFEKNPKVVYIQHERNKNGSAARNTGFRNSKGEFIAFLDDDDEFYPTKVANQVKRLKELPDDFGLCYSKYETCKRGKRILICRETREGNLLLDALMRNMFISAGSNLLIRRKAFEEIGGFDESFKRNQDLEFLVRILEKYKIAYDSSLGLRVNAAEQPRNIDYLEATNRFLKAFEPTICKLSEKQRKKVLKMINLQTFRYYLLTKRDLSSAWNMIKVRSVDVLSVSRYMLHLVKRAILHSSEGFWL